MKDMGMKRQARIAYAGRNWHSFTPLDATFEVAAICPHSGRAGVKQNTHSLSLIASVSTMSIFTSSLASTSTELRWASRPCLVFASNLAVSDEHFSTTKIGGLSDWRQAKAELQPSEEGITKYSMKLGVLLKKTDFLSK